MAAAEQEVVIYQKHSKSLVYPLAFRYYILSLQAEILIMPASDYHSLHLRFSTFGFVCIECLSTRTVKLPSEVVTLPFFGVYIDATITTSFSSVHRFVKSAVEKLSCHCDETDRLFDDRLIDFPYLSFSSPDREKFISLYACGTESSLVRPSASSICLSVHRLSRCPLVDGFREAFSTVRPSCRCNRTENR